MKTKNETSAGGIVFRKTDKKTLWLITQHSLHKGWGFPKGLVGDKETGESMEEAALREVGEEGGVKAVIVDHGPAETSYSYRWKGSPHAKGETVEYLVHKKVYYFLMEYVSGDPKNHDWEMMDARFAPEEEVKKTLTYPADVKAFEELLERIRKQKG